VYDFYCDWDVSCKSCSFGFKIMIKFIIQGCLPTLNEYTSANRRNKYAGAKMKADTETLIAYHIKTQLTEKERLTGCFALEIDWYEKDSRKDFDNVAMAQKFVLDSLTACGIIPNDSRKYFTEMQHRIFVDKLNPRVEVRLIER